MADDHADQTRPAMSPWHRDPASGPGSLSAISDLVLADAVVWRSEMSFSDGQAERRLRALLAQNPSAAEPAGTAFNQVEMPGKSAPSDHASVPEIAATPVEREQKKSGGAPQPEGLNKPMPGEPMASKGAASQSVRWTSGRGRALIVATAGLAVAVLLAFIFGVRPWLGTTPNTGPFSFPPPVFLHWSSAAAKGSTSAEQAFVRGATLTPCTVEYPSFSAPRTGQDAVAASALDIIWLENGPTYGIALIQFTCPSGTREHGQSIFWLVSLGNQPRWGWLPSAGDSGPRPDSSGTPAPSGLSAAVPAWLALPGDQYSGRLVPPCGETPPVAWQDWYSATRTFVAGHVADRALMPADAQPVTIDGKVGWMAEEHGIASVVVPLADGTTFFFTGGVTSTQVQGLAAQALTHLSALLPAVYLGMPISDCN